MPLPPPCRRAFRTALVALSVVGLIALGAAPPAVAASGASTPQSRLYIGKIAPIHGVKPDSTLRVPVVVANKGTTTVDKVWLFYSATWGLGYADIPSNCQSHQVHTYDTMPVQKNVVCEFDQVVKPGVYYAPEKPLVIKALDYAFNDDLIVAVSFSNPGEDENGSTPVSGTAPAVTLVEHAPVPLAPFAGSREYGAGSVHVPVTAVNTADFQVTGDRVKGRVGDTVTLKVTFTNAGPAWVLGSEKDWHFEVLVTMPAGVTVLKRDYAFCEPHGGTKGKNQVFACSNGERWVYNGEKHTFTFTLRIDKRVAGAGGSIGMTTEARPFDHDRADNWAPITLDVTNGGAELATTGSSDATLPLAGAGAAALAVGAGALLAVRRRRTAARD